MSGDQLVHGEYGFLLFYLALIDNEALSPIVLHLRLLGIMKLRVRLGDPYSVSLLLCLIRIHVYK